MSITQELENINDLESVGFDHKQAKVLTKIIEQSHVDSHESLKEFIRSELDSKINGLRNDLNSRINGLHNDLDSKIDGLCNDLDSKVGGLRNDLDSKVGGLRNDLMSEIKDLKVYIAESQKDLLIKLFGIIVGTVGLAVTILKLFP